MRRHGQPNRMIFIVASLVIALFAFSAVGLVGSAFADTQAAEAQRALDGLVSVIDRGCQQNLGNREPTTDLPNIQTLEVTNQNTLKGTLSNDNIVAATASGCGKITIDGGSMSGGTGITIRIEYEHFPDNEDKQSIAHLSRVNN